MACSFISYGEAIYCIMQSSLEKISKKLSMFSFSERKSAVHHLVYFDKIRSNHSAYKIAAMTMPYFINSTFLVLLFLYVMLHNNGVN